MDRGSSAQWLSVQVAYSPRAGEVDQVSLSVAAGATVGDAVRESGLLARHPVIDMAVQRVGVWGKLCAAQDPLRDQDRVEIYRPLSVDPKEARRLRYALHRERFKRRGP